MDTVICALKDGSTEVVQIIYVDTSTPLFPSPPTPPPEVET
jgi:hypothetical protein